MLQCKKNFASIFLRVSSVYVTIITAVRILVSSTLK